MVSVFNRIVGRFVGLLCLGGVAMGATCERDVELDLADDPKLVLTCRFNDVRAPQDSGTLVYLHESQGILEDDVFAFYQGANVELWQGSELLETLTPLPPVRDIAPPRYAVVNTTFEQGVDYTIEVDLEGFPKISATDRIPVQVPIAGLSSSNVEAIDISSRERTYSYDIDIEINDPLAVDNYYHLNFYQQIFRVQDGDTIRSPALFNLSTFSSSSDVNDFGAFFQGGLLFSDESFDGELKPFSFPLNINIDPNTQALGAVVAELRTVSKTYFEYHRSLSRASTGSVNSIFTQPVVVASNVENGLGVFAGYTLDIQAVSLE